MRFIIVEIVLTSVPRSPLISPNLIWWNNTAASVGLDRDTLNRFSTCKKKKGRTNCPASLHLAIGLPCLLSWFSQINEQFVLPFFFWTGTAQAPEQHAYLLLTQLFTLQLEGVAVLMIRVQYESEVCVMLFQHMSQTFPPQQSMGVCCINFRISEMYCIICMTIKHTSP